jgi:hypothetical protein
MISSIKSTTRLYLQNSETLKSHRLETANVKNSSYINYIADAV